MDEVKRKVLSLNGTVAVKSADNEASERRVRFVASSVNRDRHYESVDVASLRLPLKKGGEIVVGGIPAEGVHDIVDIPLMLNHSADVRDVIGSVRSAFFENGELVFECGISGRDLAQEMLVLLEEGHLSNAFSITMADFDYNFEAETISNAEVIEVSLVYRGSNKESRLLAVKSLKEKEEMEQVEKRASTDSFGEQIPEVETPAEGQTAQSGEKEEVKKEEKEVNTEIAKDEVKKALPSQNSRHESDYLSTKAAVADFANILAKYAGEDPAEVKKAWSDNLKAKGLTNPETLLPGSLVSAITDAVEKSGTIFNVVNKTGLTVLRIGADTIDLTNEKGRAKGHKSGNDKKESEITLVDRVLRAQFIYQYLTLNKEDVRENQDTGALVKYVLETLPKRILAEVERAIVIGDGRSAEGDEITSFISLKADAEDTTKPFATKYVPKKGEQLYESIINAEAEILAEGDVYLVMSKKAKAGLKLSKTDNGNLIFPIGSDLGATFEVKDIFTPTWMNETNEPTYQAFMFVADAYKTVGDNSIENFTNFALKQNKYEYLQEIYAGGGLGEAKAAVGIAVPAAA